MNDIKPVPLGELIAVGVLVFTVIALYCLALYFFFSF